MALDGSYSILYSFSAVPMVTALVCPVWWKGIDGNFYGARVHGGAYGHGTIFKLTPTGMLTTLVAFTGTDGVARVIGPSPATSEGQNFYGTTTQVAPTITEPFQNECRRHTHTWFRLMVPNGDWAQALIQAKDDSFYGRDFGWPARAIMGTIFQVAPNGALTSLNQPSTGTQWRPAIGWCGSDGYLYGNDDLGGTTMMAQSFALRRRRRRSWTAAKSGSTFKLSGLRWWGRTTSCSSRPNLAASASG